MFEFLNDPAQLAVLGAIVLGLLGVLRAVGDLLINIGNTGKHAANNNDWFDSTGALLHHAADFIGRAMSFIGIGNRQKYSPPEDPEKNG